MASNGVNGHSKSLDWETFQNTVDGKLESTSKTRHGINPATGKPNAEVPVATQDDVERVMAAAKKASKSWAQVPWDDRAKALASFADALEAEHEAFSKNLVKEQGKPVGRSQLSLQLRFTDWHFNSCNSRRWRWTSPFSG